MVMLLPVPNVGYSTCPQGRNPEFNVLLRLREGNLLFPGDHLNHY